LLVKLEFEVHHEWSGWLQFHGAVEQDDQAQRISFAVPPLPAGRYAEHFDVYDACGLFASLSAFGNNLWKVLSIVSLYILKMIGEWLLRICVGEDDQRHRLLAGLNRIVDVKEAEQGT
jgi:hypothetical protein